MKKYLLEISAAIITLIVIVVFSVAIGAGIATQTIGEHCNDFREFRIGERIYTCEYLRPTYDATNTKGEQS